jgi:hypothetical protein
VAANTNPKKWLEIRPLDKADVDRLKVFEKEYSDYFNGARERVETAVMPSVVNYSDEAMKARSALQFLVDYGMGSKSEALKNLRIWLAEPSNLPSATEWAEAMIATGATREEVNAALSEHVRQGMKLIEDLGSGLSAQTDLFRTELNQLRSMERERPRPL